MNEELKKLIENAKPCDHGIFDEFLIIPSEEDYDGFWGQNGFKNLIILATRRGESEWIFLSNSSDVFHLINIYDCNFDSPSELGCVRAFLNRPVEINGVQSSIMGYGMKR